MSPARRFWPESGHNRVAKGPLGESGRILATFARRAG